MSKQLPETSFVLEKRQSQEDRSKRMKFCFPHPFLTRGWEKLEEDRCSAEFLCIGTKWRTSVPQSLAGIEPWERYSWGHSGNWGHSGSRGHGGSGS